MNYEPYAMNPKPCAKPCKNLHNHVLNLRFACFYGAQQVRNKQVKNLENAGKQ